MDVENETQPEENLDTKDNESQEDILDVRQLLDHSTKKQANLAPVLELDIGNLIAFDYQEQQKGFSIKDQTQLCMQELFNQVFNMEVVASEAGPLVKLPPGTTRIPREKPPPAPKVPTKWEEFAKTKGIVKRKKSRMVWDDIAKEYRPRWGKDRALDPERDAWVLEDKPERLAESGAADPFELNAMKRKEAAKKQHERELLNKRKAARAISGAPVTIQLHNNPKKEKQTLERAVGIAQKATASMGKYDKAVPDQPKLKRKPKYLPDDISKEQEISSKIVENVLRHQDKIDANKAGNMELERQQRSEPDDRKKKRRKS